MQIGIIGTGMVGAAAAFALASEGSAEKLILIDANKERAIAEAMDISHATPFTFGAKVIAGDYKDLSEAGIIFITAGANQKPGETRLDLLEKNVAIFKSIIPEVVKYAPNAILVIAANPVDIMTEVTLKLSGFPKNRVFGTGTVLDSARFRSILGRHLGVSPKSIHANVIGEHGDSEVLLWSSAVAGTSCVENFAKECDVVLDNVIKGSIDNEVRNSAYTIIKGKGSTYYGIAAATQYILSSIISDKHAILTVSSHHDEGIGGHNNICYSMPSIVSKNGVERALMPAMCDSEREALEKSAATLAEYTEKALAML
ncbi:MAG: L-lactate dehydrogenase [Acetobacter sp.]|nr:L-lactate dehydrogenase [Acetobacter sp.]